MLQTSPKFNDILKIKYIVIYTDYIDNIKQNKQTMEIINNALYKLELLLDKEPIESLNSYYKFNKLLLKNNKYLIKPYNSCKFSCMIGDNSININNNEQNDIKNIMIILKKIK